MRKVVLERPGVVRIAEEEPYAAGEGQATVRLRIAGICGSDLSAYRGTSALVSYPRVLGHEILVDVLENRGGRAPAGRRAVLDPMIPCYHCRACRAGRPNCCAQLKVRGVHVDGGLREQWTVEGGSLFPVPDGMRDEVAVLTEPLTVAYQAVRRSGIEAGRIGLVFGAGTIGLLIASLLVRARGCRALVVDRDLHRLEVAESMGATPLHGDDETLRALVSEATGGDMADVVFEASGSNAATALTPALVAHAGRIVLVGWNQGPVALDTVTLMRKEVDVLASRNSLDAFPAALRLLAGGVVDVEALITHRFPLEEAGAALEVLDSGRDNALKVLITSG